MEKKKGTLLRVSQQVDSGYWLCQTTEKGGNHTMNEHTIKKRYRPAEPADIEGLRIDAFSPPSAPAKMSVHAELRVERNRPTWVSKKLWDTILNFVTYRY